MGAALHQPFLVQLVEHPDQRDRLDAKPIRHLGLADPFVAGDVQDDRRLSPRDQPGNIMDEETECAPYPGGSQSFFLDHYRKPRSPRSFTRRHDDSPPGLVLGYRSAPPADAMAGTDGRSSSRPVQDRDRSQASYRASAIATPATRRRSRRRAAGAVPRHRHYQTQWASRRTARRTSSS